LKIQIEAPLAGRPGGGQYTLCSTEFTSRGGTLMKRCSTALLLLVLAATAFGARAAQEGEGKKVTPRGHELVPPDAVKFKAGTDKSDAGGDAALRPLAEYLKAKKFITLVRVEGHAAGGRGQELSERRALAVARRLAELGVECERLVAVGFGDTKPLEAGGAEANERVAFFNAALGGRLIGGAPADGGGKSAGEVCKKE
jgi:OmpA-OmpF porin, OOP family